MFNIHNDIRYSGGYNQYNAVAIGGKMPPGYPFGSPLIDADNFHMFINTATGAAFLGELKKQNFQLWERIAKTENTSRCLKNINLFINGVDKRSDLLRQFNAYFIFNFDLNINSKTDIDCLNYILNSAKGVIFLSALEKEYDYLPVGAAYMQPLQEKCDAANLDKSCLVFLINNLKTFIKTGAVIKARDDSSVDENQDASLQDSSPATARIVIDNIDFDYIDEVNRNTFINNDQLRKKLVNFLWLKILPLTIFENKKQSVKIDVAGACGEKTVSQKLLEYLAGISPEKLAALKDLSNTKIGEKLKDELDAPAATIGSQLSYIQRITGTKDITTLASDAKILLKGGKVEKEIHLTDIAAEDSISHKLIRCLAKLSPKDAANFEGCGQIEFCGFLVKKFGGIMLNEKINSVSITLTKIRRIIGAKTLADLSKKSKALMNGEKITRPPAALGDIVRDEPITSMVLHCLETLGEDELSKFAGLTDLDAGIALAKSKELKSLGLSSQTIALYIGRFKKYLRERNLPELVRKWKKLKAGDKLLGYNFLPKARFIRQN